MILFIDFCNFMHTFGHLGRETVGSWPRTVRHFHFCSGSGAAAVAFLMGSPQVEEGGGNEEAHIKLQTTINGNWK
jgi:hypothetical protein